jgi:transposase
VERRAAWKIDQYGLDIEKLVFLDESGVNLGMTRLYGWGAKSERVLDFVPDVRFDRSSIIAALRLDGIHAPVTFEGALDGDFFRAYVEQALAPTLRAGDIVVMDNASAHKVVGALQPIYDKGAGVLFLPPYSPDFNPIELAWSKIKSILRALKSRTHETLQSALCFAINSITPEDIRNWFVHDGYFFTQNMSM